MHNLRGETSLADRIEWDNRYIQHWSLWLDLKIGADDHPRHGPGLLTLYPAVSCEATHVSTRSPSTGRATAPEPSTAS